MPRHGFSAVVPVVWFCVFLAGCARSPQVNFYTLAPLTQSVAGSPPPPFSVAVAAVTLPDVVDRPQLVLFTDSSRVRILESHRWAEPLKNAIPRLLAENLSRLLGTESVSCYPQSTSQTADYRITVDVLRFESSASTVLLEALWTVRTAAQTVGKPHRFRGNEPLEGDGHDKRVAAYNRVLASLSREVAGFLQDDAFRELSLRTERRSVQ